MKSKKNVKKMKISFTGERLIPELNKGTAFYYEHLARYLFVSQLVKNKIVLDAGCGSGYGSFVLVKYGKAKKVYAVDLSQDTIKYAQSKYFNKNITFQADNVEALKTVDDKSMDIIVSFELIEHLKNQESFLDQTKRALKKDGLFIVSTPNKYTYPKGNPFHTKELYPEEFSLLLKKFFKNVSFHHQNFEFIQLIKPENLKENFELEEKFYISETKIFTNKINPKNSQYIIALCSDDNLPKTQLLSITSKKVDSFDLTFGMISLSKQFQNIHRNLEILKDENKNLQGYIKEIKIKSYGLEDSLNKIKSSKFFKLWQSYCKIRDKFLKKKYEKKTS